MPRTHPLRFALLVWLAAGSAAAFAQSAGGALRPAPHRTGSYGDVMRAVAAVHPTFTGVYITEGESPRVHINAAGPIDAPAVAALIDSLFSLTGSGRTLGPYTATAVAAHRVRYTYVQLDEWQHVAGQALFSEGPHLESMGMDQYGTIGLGFGPGISVGEIERLLATLDIPRDAFRYRGGTVLESGPASVPCR